MASPAQDDNPPDSDSSSSSEEEDLVPTNSMFGVDKPWHTSEPYVYVKTPKVKPNKDDLQPDLDPNLSDVEKDLEMKDSMEQDEKEEEKQEDISTQPETEASGPSCPTQAKKITETTDNNQFPVHEISKGGESGNNEPIREGQSGPHTDTTPAKPSPPPVPKKPVSLKIVSKTDEAEQDVELCHLKEEGTSDHNDAGADTAPLPSLKDRMNFFEQKASSTSPPPVPKKSCNRNSGKLDSSLFNFVTNQNGGAVQQPQLPSSATKDVQEPHYQGQETENSENSGTKQNPATTDSSATATAAADNVESNMPQPLSLDDPMEGTTKEVTTTCGQTDSENVKKSTEQVMDPYVPGEPGSPIKMSKTEADISLNGSGGQLSFVASQSSECSFSILDYPTESMIGAGETITMISETDIRPASEDSMSRDTLMADLGDVNIDIIEDASASVTQDDIHDDSHDDNPDDRHDVSPDARHDVSPDDKHDVSPDDRHDVSPDDKHDVSPDDNPDDSHDYSPDDRHDDSHDDNPDDRHDVSPDDRHDVSPDDKHDVSPDDRHDVSPDDKHDVSSDDNPDDSHDDSHDDEEGKEEVEVEMEDQEDKDGVAEDEDEEEEDGKSKKEEDVAETVDTDSDSSDEDSRDSYKTASETETDDKEIVVDYITSLSVGPSFVVVTEGYASISSSPSSEDYTSDDLMEKNDIFPDKTNAAETQPAFKDNASDERNLDVFEEHEDLLMEKNEGHFEEENTADVQLAFEDTVGDHGNTGDHTFEKHDDEDEHHGQLEESNQPKFSSSTQPMSSQLQNSGDETTKVQVAEQARSDHGELFTSSFVKETEPQGTGFENNKSKPVDVFTTTEQADPREMPLASKAPTFSEDAVPPPRPAKSQQVLDSLRPTKPLESIPDVDAFRPDIPALPPRHSMSFQPPGSVPFNLGPPHSGLTPGQRTDVPTLQSHNNPPMPQPQFPLGSISTSVGQGFENARFGNPFNQQNQYPFMPPGYHGDFQGGFQGVFSAPFPGYDPFQMGGFGGQMPSPPPPSFYGAPNQPYGWQGQPTEVENPYNQFYPRTQPNQTTEPSGFPGPGSSSNNTSRRETLDSTQGQPMERSPSVKSLDRSPQQPSSSKERTHSPLPADKPRKKTKEKVQKSSTKTGEKRTPKKGEKQTTNKGEKQTPKMSDQRRSKEQPTFNVARQEKSKEGSSMKTKPSTKGIPPNKQTQMLSKSGAKPQGAEPVERQKVKNTGREKKSSPSGSKNISKPTKKSEKEKPSVQKAAEDKRSDVIRRDKRPQTTEDLDETEFYVLVKGLASRNETDAFFENLVEVKSGKDVKPGSLIFDVERACCMCVLIGKPDMTTFNNKMAAVEGFKMTVHELPAPSCVVVSADEELNSYSPLLYYLEYKGGANTLDDQAEFTEDGNCYIVRFETSEAVKKLMQHPHHEVNQIPLRMSPYFTCSEGHIYDYNLHRVPIPEDVTVTQSSHLMEFLQRPCCAALTTLMETCHTTASFQEDGVVLHCTLTSRVKNCRLLVKTWEAKSRNQLDQYIQETIEQRTISVPEKIWEKFEQLINSGENMADLEMMIKTNSEFQEVKVVGLKADVEKTIVYMDKTIQSLDRKIRRTTERKSKLDFCKLNLLKRTGFFNNLENSFEDLKVSIEDDDTVELEGVQEDITSGFVRIYTVMEKIEEKQQEHNFSRHHVTFICKDAVRKYINEKLRGVDAKVEWKVKDDNIIICSPPEETIQDHLWDLIEKSVLETRINLGSDKAVDLFETEEWFNTPEQEITRRFSPKVEIVPPNMTDRYTLIVSTDDVHQKVIDIVKRFLTENLVIDELLPCDSISLAYTKRFLTDKVGQIVEGLEEHKVAVKYDSSNGVEAFGTEKGLSLVRKRLKDLLNQITCESKTFQNVGLEHVLLEELNCGSIKRIEDETRCIVKLPQNLEIYTQFDGSSVDPPQHPSAQGHSRGATGLQSEESMSSDEVFTTKNGIRVDLVKGQINQQKGDVLVCSSHPMLRLESGAACKSLLQSAGQGLQDECNQNYPEGIKHGQVAEVKGGRLQCKKVYLTALPEWSSGNATKVLNDVMDKCMIKASRNSYKSIVFAAMGTGQMKYPKEVVSQVMYEAVVRFDANNPQTAVKEVKFVLYQKDTATIQAFEAQEKKLMWGSPSKSPMDFQASAIKVDLRIESLEKQSVDVIICTTSPNLDLTKSGAGKALLKAGGDTLQKECKNHGGELKQGEILCISPGKLTCTNVYLTVLPEHKQAGSEKVLEDVVKQALTLATKSNYKSLALPALGTGYLNYPRDSVAQIILNAVRNFSTSTPASCVKSVSIILFYKDQDTIQAFQSAVRSMSRQGVLKDRRLTAVGTGARPKIPTPSRHFNLGLHDVQVRQVRINLVAGNILEQTTDVIVNTVTSDMKFVGAVAQQLVKKCPSVKKEFKKKEQKFVSKGGKGVIKTSAGSLKAGNILHICFQKTTDDWTNIIRKCLEKANKKKFASIAFPVLGTGAGATRLTEQEIAGCFFDAVEKFSGKHPNSSLNEVFVVVYDKQKDTMMEPIMKTFGKKIQQAAMSSSSTSKSTAETIKHYAGKVLGYIYPQPDKDKGRISSVQVHIYSDTEKNIRDCIRKMDALLNEKYSTAKLFHDIAVVKVLTKEQMSEIENMPFLVDIKIDQAAGVITINGPTIAVDDAKTEILRKLRQVDRHMKDKEEEGLLFQQTRWFYEEVTADGFVHTKYEKSVNLIIERAYKNNDGTAQFVDQDGISVEIDFSKMEETMQDPEYPPLKVIRKDILVTKKGISLPEHWDLMKDDENIKMVMLKPTDPEYQQLEKEFMGQVKKGGYTSRIQYDVNKMKIDKIERVQNKHLWQQYIVRKVKIEKEKPTLPADMKPLERRVWHGTAATALTSIETYGFNRSYCGVNGTWYGEGVYFASDASYSARGWLSGAQNTGPTRGYVFSVRAVTGHYTKGNDKMRFLPPIDPAKPLILFDSAVDKLQNPVEFVIFHDTQAYPEHLITFSAN